MDTYDQKSREYYSNLALNKANRSAISGRYDIDKGKEPLIANDILTKLDLRKKQVLFDIGCGASPLTEILVKHLIDMEIQATFMDVDAVINVLTELPILKTGVGSQFRVIKGYFPYDYREIGEVYDRILLYGVIQCTGNPFKIIREAVDILGPGGKLLVGDLPNISQKGRFLSSDSGAAFEAKYRNTSREHLPMYVDHHAYVHAMKNDPDYYSLIDDSFVRKVYDTFTNEGLDVFVMPQPEELPFGKTRHDILIRKYD